MSLLAVCILAKLYGIVRWQMAYQEKTKLTLRINARLVEQAKQFASQHDTSVSQLVETYFQDLKRRQGRIQIRQF